jgi:hypothetical protein
MPTQSCERTRATAEYSWPSKRALQAIVGVFKFQMAGGMGRRCVHNPPIGINERAKQAGTLGGLRPWGAAPRT